MSDTKATLIQEVEQNIQRHIENPPTAHHEVAEEVLAASSAWVKAFNKGDVDTCVASYQKEAVMKAMPFGEKKGHEEIDGFWRPFVASGATDLSYMNVAISVINDTTALLSANWKMNVGYGIIYEEKWVKEDGKWLLAYDEFEVLKQYEK